MARYRAFLSYSSLDRETGDRLHRALERYKVPRTLRGRTTGVGPVPKRVQPIFRDRSDLVAAASLSSRIEEALAASNFLIVLCTPAAAASAWVNREIATFKALGRSDRIVAVLAGGMPRMFDVRNAPDGAFPPALIRRIGPGGRLSDELEDEEPFAPDLREPGPDHHGGDGFRQALLKVVARLIDVPLAELTQRQREAERAERRVRVAVAAALATLAALGAGSSVLTARQTDVAQQSMTAAIETAIRQSRIATELRDEEGVPSRVSRRLFDEADRDAAELVAMFQETIGERPAFRFLRLRLALALAQFSEEVGDLGRQRALLNEAEGLLLELENTQAPIFAKLRLIELPEDNDIARARFDLLRQRVAMLRDDNRMDESLGVALSLQRTAAERMAAGAVSWRRLHSESLCTIAEVRFQAAEPRQAYRDQSCLAAEEAIAKQTQALEDRLRVLAALTETAKVARAADDRERSVALLSRAAGLAGDLSDVAPHNTAFRRSEMIALSNLGDAILSARQDAAGALEPFSRALLISDVLVAQDGQRADWQRDRAILLERIASARLQASGSLERDEASAMLSAADAGIEGALGIQRRLLRGVPTHPEWRRDLSVLLEVRGSILAAAGRLAPDAAERADRVAAAGRAYDECIAIRRALLDDFPEDPVAAHDLANAFLLSAQAIYDATGDMAGAFERLDDADTRFATLKARAKARAADPEAMDADDWDFQRAIVRYRKAEMLLDAARSDDALAQLREALAILTDLSAQPQATRLFTTSKQHVEEKIAALLAGSSKAGINNAN